jgi:hypothetical protein
VDTYNCNIPAMMHLALSDTKVQMPVMRHTEKICMILSATAKSAHTGVKSWFLGRKGRKGAGHLVNYKYFI